MAQRIAVPPANEFGFDVAKIAEAITKIADASKAIYNSGLNEKAILLLISNASGVSQRDVKFVLSNMYHLKTTFLAAPKQVGK